MSDKPFHLGWFTNFTPPEWEGPWASGEGNDWTGAFYVDMARSLERACFDYMILEDTCMVADAYGGTMDGSLRNAVFAPKHDPVPLATLIAAATSRLGVVATMSTTFYPPYMLARVSSTIDHISGGRFGWNIVSSAEDRGAQNFGMDAMPEHDLRYDMADEYFDLVCQLWDSWDPDAVVMDSQRGVYADHHKVHASTSKASSTSPGARSTPCGRRRVGPSSSRPGRHPGGASSPPAAPIRSSPWLRA
jgi:alkanesulfonate monooxygenase SsuD/methylene tetrahydromethanopterin reductase-like flavin-dependent oxidoreductase (luciferase family)